jgi:hypothetical protein
VKKPKNEKVTPRGKPADVKPINNGMDEQEQKGVTVPKQSSNGIRANSMKASQYFFSPFRWKETLNIRNNEN